jgi:hypothetical protein
VPAAWAESLLDYRSTGRGEAAVKLASFNVENLFARPRVFHRGD